MRQPFRKSLNLEQTPEEVEAKAKAKRLINDGGPGYQPATWTPTPGSTQA